MCAGVSSERKEVSVPKGASHQAFATRIFFPVHGISFGVRGSVGHANKLEFDKSKTANDRYVKWYLETTEKPDMEFLKSRKKDYLIFERLVYDRRLIRVNFHKYWWESGMN